VHAAEHRRAARSLRDGAPDGRGPAMEALDARGLGGGALASGAGDAARLASRSRPSRARGVAVGPAAPHGGA